MKAQYIVFILLLVLESSYGGIIEQLLGKWNGNIPNTTETVVFKRFEGDGLISVTTFKIDGQSTVMKGTTKYYPSGKLKGEVKHDGITTATLSGTWSISKGTLRSKFKTYGAFPTSNTNSVVSMVSPNRIKTDATVNPGEIATVSYLTRSK